MNIDFTRTHHINNDETVEIGLSEVTPYEGIFSLENVLKDCITLVALLKLSDRAKGELVAALFNIEIVERRTVIIVEVV